MSAYINLWKASYFSFLFLVIYTPNAVVANLTSHTMEANGLGKLGFVMLAILYFFQGTCAIIASPLI